jgi:hypothetical protein
MLRVLTISLLLGWPGSGEGQVVPEYFVRDEPVLLREFVGCKYVSSAVGVIRQAQDTIQSQSAKPVVLTPISNCSRYQAGQVVRSTERIIVQATLATYKTTASDGTVVTLYIHTYRRIDWRVGRYEYLVSTAPIHTKTE